MPTPCTVTGTLNQLSGGLIGQGKVLFQLTNIGTGNPIGVTGTSIIPQLTYSILTAQNGTFTVSLWGNDNINPANTLYSVTFFDTFGNSMGPVLYSITGASLNLNTAIAANTTSPPILVGSPAIVGNPLAPQTITGQPLTLTSSAPLNVASTATFTGNILAKNIESVLYVDPTNTAGWASALNCTTDINVCLAAAYAALPATGGRIRIASSATTYNMSTAFSATVAGKHVTIEGDPGGAVIINWTPTNGTAFTFDTRLNANQHPIGMGMRDLVLTTSGAVSSTAITLGNINSAEGYEFQRMKIENFITGITVTATGNISFANKFDNISFRNLTFGLVGASGMELGKVIGGSFFNVGTGISGGGDWVVEGTSCDDPGAGGCVGNSVIVYWSGGHFENPGLGLPTYVNSNGTVVISGGVADDDVTSGTNSTSWFTNTGIDAMIVDGIDLISGGRSMVTNPVFSFGANGRGALRAYNKSSALLGTKLYADNAFQFNKITDMSFDLNGVLTAAIPGPIKLLEVAAPTGIAATDFLYADSTAHRLKMNNNNTGADVVVGAATTDTLTNKTLTAPAITTTAFASLGAVPAAGIAKYCTDCTTAATCAGAGTGHLAVSNGTNWTCQ